MQDKAVIFYHGNDWEGVPSRQRYLMAALACYVPVIYLDGSGDARGRVTYMHPQENVTVVRGLVPILNALRRRRLDFLQTYVAHWHLRPLCRHKRILFWNMENWLRPYRFIRHDALIFDCIDPAFTHDALDQRLYDEREREALQAAQVVFASADALVEHCRRYNPNATLLNNACSPEDYCANLLEEAPRPDWWPRTDTPIAAYLGSIDLRFDFDIVEYACVHNTNCHFILAGYTLPQFETRMNALRASPNVTVTGKISVREGRYLLSRCHIGLIPFRMGAMNDNINPVKMYAYALLGKPIVGTAVRELVARPDLVLTADTPEKFSRAIDEALVRAENPTTAVRLNTFAQANTWEARATQAWDAIKEL